MTDAELVEAVTRLIYAEKDPKRHGMARLEHLRQLGIARSKAARIITLVRSNS